MELGLSWHSFLTAAVHSSLLCRSRICAASLSNEVSAAVIFASAGHTHHTNGHIP